MSGFSCRTQTQILIVVLFRPKTMNSDPWLVDSNSNRQRKIKASGVWIPSWPVYFRGIESYFKNQESHSNSDLN